MMCFYPLDAHVRIVELDSVGQTIAIACLSDVHMQLLSERVK